MTFIRARQNHLWEAYVEKKEYQKDKTKLLKDMVAAVEFFRKKVDAEVDQDKKKMLIGIVGS